MAVHVIPYNPWREQLALTALGNVAGDIIGDLWKSHRQNEQNRKANAFRGQLRQNLQNNSTQQDISLIPKEAPNGYNANPWAAAFHQDNSPLTQFDFGTSSVGKTPTLQDIANTADNLAATKRFSMLDTKTVNDIRDNFMQQSIGDMFANAGDIQGQMNTLTRGAAQGLVAPQVLTAFSPYAMKILSPYTFHESHLGKNNVISALNEITGEANPALIMPVSVSPDTEANNQASRDVANIHAGASLGAARIGADANMFGDTTRAGTENRRLDILEGQNEWERKNPTRTVHTDKNGRVVTISPITGRAETVYDENNQPIMDNPPPKDLGERDRAALKSLEIKREELIKRYNSLASYRGPGEAMSEEEQSLYAQIEECNKEIDKIINPPQPASIPGQNQPVIGQPPISADVQKQQSADQTPITAMGASSPDVRPKAQATQPSNRNSSPSYTQRLYSQYLARNNISDDVRPVTPQAPAPVQPPAKKKNTVSFPTSAVYEPSRDTNVSADMIKSLSDLYSDYINYKNQLNLPPTFQEFLNNCIKDGVKIRHETSK